MAHHPTSSDSRSAAGVFSPSAAASLLRDSLILLLALLLSACATPPQGTPARCAGDVADSPECQAASRKPGDKALAPELEGGDAWLNTDRPLKLSELRGHVVVLDFWTYCCINCMHVLPELEALERHFAGKPVVVIGVHSGKFDAEKDARRIRDAMARHGVNHPVVVDSEFRIWRAFGVNAWPTLVVIDTDGTVAATNAGEPKQGALQKVVGSMLARAAANGTLAKNPVVIKRPAVGPDKPLSYPGKVAVAADGTIAIADSNHHRIVLSDLDGNVTDVVGSAIAGSADGDFEQAAFRRPQGLAFSEDGAHLFVADTDNHQLRRLDLRARTVTTIAGTGRKGEGRGGSSGRQAARNVALRSPWALAKDGDFLYVAMAGSHQIWRHDLAANTIASLAGSGRENIDDGAFDEASFSQPSGLALVGDVLYVADSEVSAVRAVSLKEKRVRTLVGKGLFEFGDRDGEGDGALLQHALGVVSRGDKLFVADTFNNKIKRLDPITRSLTSVVGGTRAELYEPGGLALLPDGRLLVADTNNHRLRVFNPETGQLRDFILRGLAPPATRGLIMAPAAARGTGGEGSGEAAEQVRAVGQLGPGAATLLLDVALPVDGKLTVGAPVSLSAEVVGSGIAVPQKKIRHTLKGDTLPLRLPLTISPGAQATLRLHFNYYWCTSGDTAACIPERTVLDVQLDLSGTAGGEAKVIHHPKQR